MRLYRLISLKITSSSAPSSKRIAGSRWNLQTGRPTRASGTKITAKAKASKNGNPAQNTRANGSKIRLMARANSNLQTEISSMDHFSTIGPTAKAYSSS